MPAEQSGDHMALLSYWAGQDVNLQQHKGSNHERKNQWNTDGLPDAARLRLSYRLAFFRRRLARRRLENARATRTICGPT